MSEITLALEHPSLGYGKIIARYDLSEIQEKAYQQGRADEQDRIINEIQNVGNRYCTNVHCDMECISCEHGSLMRAIVEIVRGGAK